MYLAAVITLLSQKMADIACIRLILNVFYYSSVYAVCFFIVVLICVCAEGLH